MSDRNHILLGLSQSLRGSPKSRRSAVSDRLRKNLRGILPERVSVSRDELVNLFISEAELADAVCERVDNLADVVDVVRDYMVEHDLGNRIWLSGEGGLSDLSWGDGFEFMGDDVDIDDYVDDGLVGLNIAYGGVAETGSLVFLSSVGVSLVQNFLCASSIVILFTDDIFGVYEDIRDSLGSNFLDSRGMIFVTGPSRTGDIAQTLELGAHGALRLKIVLVKNKPKSA